MDGFLAPSVVGEAGNNSAPQDTDLEWIPPILPSSSEGGQGNQGLPIMAQHKSRPAHMAGTARVRAVPIPFCFHPKRLIYCAGCCGAGDPGDRRLLTGSQSHIFEKIAFYGLRTLPATSAGANLPWRS
jgi:hypothetical protein